MATELVGTNCYTGELSLTSFFGGTERGESIQLTFKMDDVQQNAKCLPYAWVQLNKEEAVELATALLQWTQGNREELED